MKTIKNSIFPIFLATIWISISEFLRNQILLKDLWQKHYQELGLTFPMENTNGAVWGIWSLCFAIAIFILSKKFTMTQTTFLSWFVGFVLMWLVIGNLNVLPFETLWYAFPLSILESFVATFIIKKLS